jgi:hypothetical protein
MKRGGRGGGPRAGPGGSRRAGCRAARRGPTAPARRHVAARPGLSGLGPPPHTHQHRHQGPARPGAGRAADGRGPPCAGAAPRRPEAPTAGHPGVPAHGVGSSCPSGPGTAPTLSLHGGPGPGWRLRIPRGGDLAGHVDQVVSRRRRGCRGGRAQDRLRRRGRLRGGGGLAPKAVRVEEGVPGVHQHLGPAAADSAASPVGRSRRGRLQPSATRSLRGQSSGVKDSA